MNMTLQQLQLPPCNSSCADRGGCDECVGPPTIPEPRAGRVILDHSQEENELHHDVLHMPTSGYID
jgi:hypothetical protein